MKRILSFLVLTTVISLSSFLSQGQTTILYQNFDGVTPPALPDGWVAENASGTGVTWRSYAAFSYSSPNSVAVFGDWQPKNEWLFSPGVELQAGVSYRVGFYYRTSFTPLQMQVKMGSGPSSAQMTQQIWLNENINNTTYTQGYTIITPSESGTVVFGWNVYDGGNNGNMYMDDISVVQLAAIPEIIVSPASWNFGTISVNETAYTTITLTNEGGAPLVVNGLEVESPFFAQYEGTILPGASDSFTVTFDPEETGMFSESLEVLIDGTFEGSNIAQLNGFVYATISGFFEDFEASDQLPDGWTAIIQSTSASANVHIYQAGQFFNHAFSGERAARMYNGTTSDTLMLVTPELANLQNGQVSFWTKVATNPEPLTIGSLSDLNDPSTFVEKATITATVEYEQYTYSFEDAPADHVYVAFMHGTSANFRPLFIDDVEWSEEPGELFPPRNLEITSFPGGGGASLTWDEPEQGEPLGYNIYRDDQIINASLVEEAFYDDGDALAGVTYLYYVTAVYTEGESDPSNIVEHTPEHGYRLIYASSGEGGQIVPEGVITLNYGDDQDFNIGADTGYHIESLIVDELPVEVAAGFTSFTYSFVNVVDFHEIHVEFAINTYALTYEAGPNGTLSGETSQTVEHGADGAPVEAIPNEGYRFEEWSDGSTENPRTDTGVTEDINVTASFEWIVAVGDETDRNTIGVYPNPAGERLYLDLPESIAEGGPSTATVFALDGQELLRFALRPGQNNLDLSGLKSGIYIMEISNSNGIVERIKFSKL